MVRSIFGTRAVRRQAAELRCEKCGSPMAIVSDRRGSWLRCSTYPTCVNEHPLAPTIQRPRSLLELRHWLMERVLSRAWSWLVHASWSLKLILLIALFVAPYFVAYPSRILGVGDACGRWTRAICFSARSVPISSSLRTELDSRVRIVADKLERHLLHALKSPPGDVKRAWSTAQLLVAVTGKTASSDFAAITPKQISDYFFTRCGRDPNAPCWKQEPSNDTDPPHFAVSAWVLVALAKVKVPAPSDVEYLLAQQDPVDGWWPLYGGALPLLHNASTYATAWCALALRAQKPLLESSLQSRVSSALDNATTWLRIGWEEGRLPDYKDDTRYPKMMSESISGLVLHVLHTAGKCTTDIDRRWLDTLPFPPPSPQTWEASLRDIQLVDATKQDIVRHQRLPWVIIATMDAYLSGTFPQRARALEWLSLVGSSQELTEVESSALKYDWIASEMLIALRYLGGDCEAL